MEINTETYIKRCIEKIEGVVIKENKLLSKIAESDTTNNLNKDIGIFHMPELAFAYECGKNIMLDANNIFDGNIPKWHRELDLGNGGPSDLVFEFKDKSKIVIEFKMRDTIEAYISDLKKLSKLQDEKTVKLFCAVIDVFANTSEKDGRVVKINNDKRTKKPYIKLFETRQAWYKKEVKALVGIWEVK